MINPISITIISYIITSILIVSIAFLIDNKPGGEQIFLTTIAYGMFFQTLLCYTIFILSSFILKKWIKENKMFYFISIALFTIYFIYIILIH